jgi:bacterioferritin
VSNTLLAGSDLFDSDDPRLIADDSLSAAEKDDAMFYDVDAIIDIDVETLREQARRHLEDDTVTTGYTADRAAVLRLLNNCLATELIGALRYRRHHFLAKGVRAKAIADVFMHHAQLQQAHADNLAERVVQLGGEPVFSPLHLLNRSYAEYVERYSLLNMIQENLVGARIMIDSYRDIIQQLRPHDAVTVRLLEQLLAAQEECADVLAKLIGDLPQEYARARRKLVPRTYN